jgi:energy-coupling factor transport system ATP-binding protein
MINNVFFAFCGKSPEKNGFLNDGPDEKRMDVLLQLKNFSYSYPDATAAVLKDINLEIEPGRCYCLTGPTGSGKTTLALALKGLLEEDGCSGEVIRPQWPVPEVFHVGLVLQNPETQLLTTTVGAEVAFGLENLCVDPQEMPARVEAALSLVDLCKPLDYPVAMLSMGQKYRLLVAALLAMEPQLLILDEPAAQLDPGGLAALCKVLSELKSRGIAVVLCEHQPGPLLALVDRFWQIDREGRLSDGRWQAVCGAPGFSAPKPAADLAAAPVLLAVRDLTFADHGEVPVWSDVSFEIKRGQCVAVTGMNGTGKTTLLRVLAGFLKPGSGSIRIFGSEPEPALLRRRLGCLFQNPHKQIFENTVREEIAFPLKRLGCPAGDRAARIEETLRLCGIEHLIDASPHKLSYGQKHLVALASVLAPAPDMLFLDDPFAGLDDARQQDVVDVLAKWNRERGITLVITSHDPGQVPALADGHLHIEGGHIGWR